MAEPQIPLADAVRALRREVIEAVREGEGEEVRFALGTIELELGIVVSNEAGGEAGITFWVVSIGGKGSRSLAATHTVRLTLTPVGPSGEKDVMVSSEVEKRPN